MGELLKIELPVDEDIASAIQAAIADGSYRDVNELLSDMLRDWHASQHEDEERLRRLWDEGLASGEFIEGGIDPADINRRGMERLQALKAK